MTHLDFITDPKAALSAAFTDEVLKSFGNRMDDIPETFVQDGILSEVTRKGDEVGDEDNLYSIVWSLTFEKTNDLPRTVIYFTRRGRLDSWSCINWYNRKMQLVVPTEVTVTIYKEI